ncbi:MAG TPA: transglycosylase SLT domain-containing protein [Pyrinomonadaceae bacterium]|nr:transglycosylase SLT domain-containing protein [Pyrinomonadaceae bacterium]
MSRKAFTVFFSSVLIAVASVFIPAIVQAQPGGSSAREIPTEVQKNEARVDQIIERANDHFRRGKLNLDDNKREQARDEFDKAVDEILMSGINVQGYPRLRDFYADLIDRVYKLEIQERPQQGIAPVIAQKAATGNAEAQDSTQPQIAQLQQPGFVQQIFVPSTQDPLALMLTDEEKQVSDTQLADLEQAKNALDFKFIANPLVQQFINYYQGRGRSTMENGLRRSGRYMKIAREAFRKNGVPEDITWLGQVESAWQNRAVSWAGASGLWQFVRGTGAQYNLRQTAWVDERNGIEKPTYAAAQYLKSLANRYNGDWLLAMAAYNTGALNVDRAISRAGEANYWKIYPYIAQETRNYVPNILAVILIAKNPEKYGFHGIRPEAPMSFESIQVPSATNLRLIADATDTSVDYIQSLNPELKRDTTPRGETYNVRVPSGRGKQLASLLKRVPADRRDTARVISVAPGEEWQAIANRTGVSVATLQAMNTGVDLKTANKVFVPNSNIRLTNWKRSGETTAAPSLTKVKARKGDTISKIAAARKLSADEVARLNGIAPDAELRTGQEIKLPAAGTSSGPSSRRR